MSSKGWTARSRLDTMASEIRELRGPRRLPSDPPSAIPFDRPRQVALLLAECALRHLGEGAFDDARRAIHDASQLLPDIRDAMVHARASLLIGEALTDLDAPEEARSHLENAMRTFDARRDTMASLRAKLAYGRALVLMGETSGIALLHVVRTSYARMGNAEVVDKIDALVRDGVIADSQPGL